ncbi:Centrosomal protein of 44 kDa [Physocladia obscura]|uniref:Centrosomal protein of 44 kDa n=1 Tax=Physocladia obscura TaxID=109957 RepID=A0AAD5T6U5_9FUNG|nr:Centrosomal protein of 44 kDa [Physocladia obscura]
MASTNTTGDIRNSIVRVQSELKPLLYSGPFDIPSLTKGDPSSFLPLIHFILLESDSASASSSSSSSNSTANISLVRYFASKNHNLYAKRDGRFIDCVYKLLRDEFNYKPVLSREQFFSNGFAERKLLFVLDLARMVKNLRTDLERKLFKGGIMIPVTSAKSVKHRTSNGANIRPEAFDPTNYSSFKNHAATGEILQELDYRNNNSPSGFRTATHTSVEESNNLKHQIRLLENLPYRSSISSAAGIVNNLIPVSPCLQNGEWISESKFFRNSRIGVNQVHEWGNNQLDGKSELPSDYIMNAAEDDFGVIHSDGEPPSLVFPTNNGDISASILHETPRVPPSPKMHPTNNKDNPISAPLLGDNAISNLYYTQQQQLHTRSILKTGTMWHPDESAQRLKQQKQHQPLLLRDLLYSSSPTNPEELENEAVNAAKINSNWKNCEAVAIDMSTSATSGSRSLNHGYVVGTSSRSEGGISTVVTRIEAARNRWNIAGLVMPAGIKTGPSSIGVAAGGESSAVLTESIRSGRETSIKPVFQGKRNDLSSGDGFGIDGGCDSANDRELGIIVENLVNVINNLLESHQNMKQQVDTLAERLAHIESNTKNFIVSNTEKSVEQDKNNLQSEIRSERQNDEAWLYGDPEWEQQEQLLSQIEETVKASSNMNNLVSNSHETKDTHLDTPTAIPGVILGNERELSINQASTVFSLEKNTIASSLVGCVPLTASGKERPTEDYIRNIEERLKATAEMIRKARERKTGNGRNVINS